MKKLIVHSYNSYCDPAHFGGGIPLITNILGPTIV